jgi:ppGpp synthetase/RelA/SpoT-type nucleotidyltranferase
MKNDYLLMNDDILDILGFVRDLCDPDNPAGVHVASLLDERLIGELSRLENLGFIPPPKSDELMYDLNNVISNKLIYDPERFKYVRLTNLSIRLLEKENIDKDMILANRLLLTEAFPRSVRLVYSNQIPDSLEWGKWYEFYVQKCAAMKKDYELFCSLISVILCQATDLYAPFAIVQTRPKSVSSFAEKILRKGYINPIIQTTDLAGARVITETQRQVGQVCEFIKRNFIIDPAESIDHRERLKADEFGYLSVHYIVSPEKKVFQDLVSRKLISVEDDFWPALANKKAEIQIRTLLQHAFANISHDRVYKCSFLVPDLLKRDLARVSALLEQADSNFGKTVESIERYAGSYGAYMDKEKRDKEVKILNTIIRHECTPSVKASTALRLALVMKSIWNWRGVADALNDHLALQRNDQARILTEYGYSLCRINQHNINHKEYNKGIQYLKRAVELIEFDPDAFPKQILIEVHANLAWALGNMDQEHEKARDEYHKAYNADPSNPYTLASYLEFEVSTGTDRNLLRHMRNTLIASVNTCRAHAEVGVELPWAYFTMGRLFLLASLSRDDKEDYDPLVYDSLAAYCKAIHLCSSPVNALAEKNHCPATCYPKGILEDEISFLRNIGKNQRREEDEWIHDLLTLGIYIIHKDKDILGQLQASTRLPKDFLEPVVIVSGATHPTVERQMRSYEGCLKTGFEGFRGTIISGGTKAGIPGIVGDLAQDLRKNGAEVNARCYLPQNLPADAPLDSRYNQIVDNLGIRFSPRQSLQTWIDLIVAGIDPCSVKLLGINGGPITAFDFKLALAMGALVGVVRDSGRAAEKLAPDPDWQDTHNLLWLPCDPMTVRAFINPFIEETPYMESMGRQIHENFLNDRWKKSRDKILRPWEFLDDDIKKDNMQQAGHAVSILRQNGYDVRNAALPVQPYEFGKDEEERVRRMGEMEHGRWIVQRLRLGWEYAREKDEEKKLNPYLVSWTQLPEDVRIRTCNFVRKWPHLLAQTGLEVFDTLKHPRKSEMSGKKKKPKESRINP